jgi:hypothetical protein
MADKKEVHGSAQSTVDAEWDRRVDVYKSLADTMGNGKYNFIHCALRGNINLQRLDELCKSVRLRKKDVDMEIVGLIRILYMLPLEDESNPSNKYAINKITSALDDFPFWPSTNDSSRADAGDLCFWSENHILMLLTSAHLYRQWRRKMSEEGSGVYIATNVVRGGQVREDNYVMHVTSLGSAIHGVGTDNTTTSTPQKNSSDKSKKKGSSSTKSSNTPEGGEDDVINDIHSMSMKVLNNSRANSPQKDKVDAAKESLFKYFSICEMHWDDESKTTTEDGDGSMWQTSPVSPQVISGVERSGASPRKDASPSSAEAEVEEAAPVVEELTGGALEEALLHSYITAHAKFGGMFEVNSHVYIPYTMSSLLNVVDFSEDKKLVEMAKKMIDAVLKPLLLCTTDANVCSLAASCRAFVRTRCRVFGHNINHMLNFLFGSSPDNLGCSSITDFLSTTKWRPSAELLSTRDMVGRVQMRLSPALSDLQTMFPGIPTIELTPFFWSAGFIVHPQVIKATKKYLKMKNMSNNATLWPLTWITTGMAESLSLSCGRYSTGQVYTDVTLNVFKRAEGLCLSSFEGFNVGSAGFQQLPWCANLDGIGVWSESGQISDSVVGRDFMTNTHSPNVVQRGGVLVCSYCAPSSLQSSLFGVSHKGHTHIIWPSQLFDKHRLYEISQVVEKGTKKSATETTRQWVSSSDSAQSAPSTSWRIASRNQCYIGLGCFQSSTVLPVIMNPPGKPDKKHKFSSPEGVNIFYDNDNHIIASRVTCKDKHSAFVVVVASHEEFAFSFDAFAERCLGITCSKTIVHAGKELKVSVADPNEGNIDVLNKLS